MCRRILQAMFVVVFLVNVFVVIVVVVVVIVDDLYTV